MSSDAQSDALLLLRASIAAETPVLPSTSEDPSTASPDLSLATATHLQFPADGSSVAIPISSATRFVSNEKPVDLRSIFFAWQHREAPIPEYNAAASSLNAELGDKGRVQGLAFVERLDLITWLEGASEESEYIKPLAGGDAGKEDGKATGLGVAGGGWGWEVDPRLREILNGERRMGDRNSVLRGIKPTVSLTAPLLRRSGWWLTVSLRTSHRSARSPKK
jgi:parafibromin